MRASCERSARHAVTRSHEERVKHVLSGADDDDVVLPVLTAERSLFRDCCHRDTASTIASSELPAMPARFPPEQESFCSPNTYFQPVAKISKQSMHFQCQRTLQNVQTHSLGNRRTGHAFEAHHLATERGKISCCCFLCARV